MKQKPCTLNPKHKWEFVKNVNQTVINGRSARLSLRGFYRCACGATKLGPYDPNGPDLRTLS
ncbi:hypothetical protein DBR23_23470 [Acidovorax sp. HMWF018]|uniref:hypothetical protein n=1 Tax=Acidovorax sp. HMWF018 TaxID=2056855 RepID=UPI000D34DF04|nr:hypothetical protein [Acidovorax sp. HMWF018]PTT35467.1 hypothetical protein DBR23_23470 [Acidovorax sp. HMWF018]